MIVFDFETYDPDLKTKGCGNVFGTLKIIGMGYRENDDAIKYTTDKERMRVLLNKHNTWVAHNISYELNCASYLGVDFSKKSLFCTRVGSILDKNTRISHSLDNLGYSILGKEKDQSRFGRYLIDNGMGIREKVFEYPKEGQKTTVKERVDQATKWCMSNLDAMHQLRPDLVEEYCKNDVLLTCELHKHFLKKVDNKLYNKFSNINKATTAMRIKGVRLDMKKLDELDEYLTKEINEMSDKIDKIKPGTNIRSNKQLGELFEEHGVPIERNPKTGNPILNKAALSEIDHPISKLVVGLRKMSKFRDDFVLKLRDLSYNGRVHGEMKVLGGRQTGRFSHNKPNLGNIPKRDKLGKRIRELFIPDEGETWYSMDFSAQEPRLAVHYASLCQKAKVKFKRDVWDKRLNRFVMSKNLETFDAKSIYLLVESYKENPALDSHTYNMDIINENTGVGISRNDTKAIALGKMYSMGAAKLADSLGITKDGAYSLIRAFDTGSPHVAMLDHFIKYKMKSNGFIKTIGGRVSWSDRSDYKALNKLIQGSAADQTGLALLELYEKHNIIPTTVVHDEINISGTPEEAQIVKRVMENIIKLEIPSLTEIEEGASWGELNKQGDDDGQT